MFQNQLAQNQQQAQQIGRRNILNTTSNLRAGGGVLGNASGFVGGMLQRASLSNSAMQGNAFNTAVNSALSNRNSALMAMQAYQPLQTGQSTTTGGLGTWLPQVAGIAANALMPGIGGMLAGTGFSSGYKGGGGGGGGSAPMSRPAPGPMPNYFMQQNYPNYGGLPSFQ
jgi:hypothetical protein